MGPLKMDSGMVRNHDQARADDRQSENTNGAGARSRFEPGNGERRGGEPDDRRGGERRERRSGYDRRRDRNRPGYVERRRGWLERGRRFISRYREPLIGLGVAAATAPLAIQGRQAAQSQRGRGGVGQPTPERGPLAGAAAAGSQADLEERVASRWAAEENASIRQDTIRGAMVRYGISRDLAADIYDIALDEEIEPDIAFGLVNTESAFQHQAVSSVGARGLTQLMPATAKWLNPDINLDDLFSRELNLHIGFGYLDRLISKYNGDIRLALLAYNRGPGTVDGVLARGGDPANGYAAKVLSG